MVRRGDFRKSSTWKVQEEEELTDDYQRSSQYREGEARGSFVTSAVLVAYGSSLEGAAIHTTGTNRK